MDNSRDVIFGRLIALATVLGDRVFEKGTPSISSQYLDLIGREPARTVERIHKKLIEHAAKFGPDEMVLLDMFGEQVALLDINDFNNDPLDKKYLIHYYKQKDELQFVGVAEAAAILGWKKQQVYEYRKRGLFPEPYQVLASGPIWTRKYIEYYRDSRK